MQKRTKNYNFYGIERFQSNPLSNNIKNELCKYIFIAPKVLAEDARIIANTYITEEHANKLLSRLRKEVNELSNLEIQRECMDPKTMMDWIEINGFLSIDEIKDFCKYCRINTSEYFEHLEQVKQFLVPKSRNTYYNYLKLYGIILNETQINWALDKYLEHDKNNINKKV